MSSIPRPEPSAAHDDGPDIELHTVGRQAGTSNVPDILNSAPVEEVRRPPEGEEASPPDVAGQDVDSPAIQSSIPDNWPEPYLLKDGLRRVAPYFHTYKTYVKQRWIGRGLFEVFSSEFRDREPEHYKQTMETGGVTINGNVVGPDHVLKNGELISHSLHRHEPPATAQPVGIIHEDDDIMVINKPAGVPVHPAGRYKFNSVVEILRAERRNEFNPSPCNRLDRLTSGIMFIGKSPKAAEQMASQIKARTVRKEYVARVIGRFPDGEVVCDQPILQISPKLGLNRIRANGRSARTVFKRLAYYGPAQPAVDQEEAVGNVDGKPWKLKQGYSIVRCLPVTGRTHQIRVHLQFLGHPIQNDPIYANQKVWGFDLGRDDADASLVSDEDIITRLSRMGKEDVAEAVAYHDEVVDQYHKKRAEKLSGETCEVCNSPLYTDPGEHELSLWLHSLRYEDAGGAWSYTSPLPEWALPPEGFSGPTEVGDMGVLVEAVKDVNPEIA